MASSYYDCLSLDDLNSGLSQLASDYIGHKIVSAQFSDGKLILGLASGRMIAIYDGASHCCERRSTGTDDDIASLVGNILTRIESKPGGEAVTDDDEDYDSQVHETCFVEVGTDQNFITLVNHNHHNGYYGGFDVVVDECWHDCAPANIARAGA